jgi:hypothetical protein
MPARSVVATPSERPVATNLEHRSSPLRILGLHERLGKKQLEKNILTLTGMTTSSRMHGEFLRLLFLQAHRKTTAHFIATGLPSQQTRSDNAFRFKHTAFYMGLKSKVGLVSAKVSALLINLNIQGCSVVAPSLHAPSRAPLLLPLLLSHNIHLPTFISV